MTLTKELYTFIDRTKGRHLIVFAITLTLVFAVSYLALSKLLPGQGIITPSENGRAAPVTFGDAIYFSIVTEATLGYGDIRPVGASRLLACSQVLLGLLWAGLTVAKITSVHSGRLRAVSHQSEGFWIKITQLKDKSAVFTFAQIFFDGEDLRYDGDNYKYDGKYEGSFRGHLISSEGNLLKFEYKNIDQTHLFDSGIVDMTFFDLNNANKWTIHKAICYDHNKSEKTYYEGFRASEEDIKIMKGKSQRNREQLIKQTIDEFNKNITDI